MLTRTVLERV